MHHSVRQRANKTSTAAELPILDDEARAAIEVPELPSDRLWNPGTSDWWEAIWRSPMRLEWDPSDHAAIVRLAYLVDEFYKLVTADEVKVVRLPALSKAIIDASARLGLDPFARRSLQWILVRTELGEAERDESKERTRASRARAAAPPARKTKGFGALE
jgi:hypothetical protein